MIGGKSRRRLLRAFARAKRGNVAMMFALSLVPITIAAGAGVDFARAMMVRSSMEDALDAAGLAVGSSPNITQAQAQALAQTYFDKNYTADSTYGSHTEPQVSINGQSVTLTVTDTLPTTLMNVAGITSLPVSASTTVVWGQTKLWVALVLDNSGSMANNGKMSALQSASKQLLTELQGAATNEGDVKVSIVPFVKDVNIGTGYLTNTAIDWRDWEAPPVDYNGNADAPGPNDGPGTNCPYTKSSDGFVCVKQPGSTSTTTTIPSSGTYKGYICPGVMQTRNTATGTGGHYFNGCYTSATGVQTITCVTPKNSSTATCTTAVVAGTYSGSTNQSCSTNGSGVKTCTTKSQIYTHVWKINDHSTWDGCLEDRQKKPQAANDYDTSNTTPAPSVPDSLFPAENNDNCLDATVTPIPAAWTSAQWTTLSNQIDAMQAAGSTNQAIGLEHGWATLSTGGLYNVPAIPANTSRIIILLSDGLNTQDRWYGDGSTESNTADGYIDDRMSAACTAAKNDGVIIYTLYVNINNSDGDSEPLQDCATDSSKFYKLTSSSQIADAFNDIAEKITNLRVSK